MKPLVRRLLFILFWIVVCSAAALSLLGQEITPPTKTPPATETKTPPPTNSPVPTETKVPPTSVEPSPAPTMPPSTPVPVDGRALGVIAVGLAGVGALVLRRMS